MPGPEHDNPAVSARTGRLTDARANVASPSFGRIALVGRDRELCELTSGLDETLAGRGCLYIVAGEPGIGKTRLADELAEIATRRGLKAIRGRCWEGGGAPPYWPWIEILRSCLISFGAARKNLPISLLREVARLLPDAAPDETPARTSSTLTERGSSANQATQSDIDRFRLFDSIVSFLSLMSAQEPLLMIVEDLHAADEASLLLLRVAARRLRSMRIMLLITCREAEARQSAILSDLLADLGHEGITVPLRGFSEVQVADFVHLASGVQLDAAVSRALYVATAGNPFFLSELVRMLVAEGRLSSNAPEHFTVSNNVRAAIRRRLGMIEEPTVRVLRIASVLGREFDSPIIRAVLNINNRELSLAVEEAIAWGLVERLPNSITRLKFAHSLIAESIYEDLNVDKRKNMHLLAAEAIREFRAGELETYLPELARHYVEALPIIEGDKAVLFSERAAEFSLRRLAYEEAVKFYEMALDAIELCDPADLKRRCLLLLGLGEALCRARRFEDFSETFHKAAALARRIQDGELLARAVLGSGMLLSDPHRSDHTMVMMLEEALTAIGKGESVLRAKLLARLAEEIRWTSAQERSMTLVDEAVEIAHRCNEPSTLVDALYVKLHLIQRPDNVDERLALVNEMVETVEQHRLDYRAFDAYYHRAGVSLELGQIERCRGDIAVLKALPQEASAPRISAQKSLNRCLL